MDEIDAAGFTPEEVLTLEERWQRARNGTRLQELVSRMLSMLEETDGPGLGSQLRRNSPVPPRPGTHGLLHSRMAGSAGGVTLELKEIENRLADYSAERLRSPGTVPASEERINLLESLK
ncbi:MAG: hypothetical protein ACLSCR_00195 [Akkermansia sp.]